MTEKSRFADWDAESLVLEEGTPPAPVPSASVIYEEGKVTAYLDDNGRPVAPHFATQAKVWTSDKDGGTKLQVISLKADSGR